MIEPPTLAQALALLPKPKPGEEGSLRVRVFIESGLDAWRGWERTLEEVAALLEAACERGEVWYASHVMAASGYGLKAIEEMPDGRLELVFIEASGGPE